MRAQPGDGIMPIGSSGAVLGAATVIAGLALRLPKLLELARRYVLVVLLAAIGAFAVMESALFAHDYSIKYVTENVARATPGLYTFTAAWGALAGSILLWSLALSVYVAFSTWHFRARATDPVVAWATVVQVLVFCLFFPLMLFPATPVKTLKAPNPVNVH